MYEYDDEVLDTFLKKQTQLFSEEVADTPEAAEEFLEDCMAVVCKNIKEVRDYFDEAGSDISGMSDDELMDQSEVFAIADGRFLDRKSTRLNSSHSTSSRMPSSA